MIVNHQAHWYPPAYFDFIAGRPEGRYPRAERRGPNRYLYEVGSEPGAWRYELQTHFLDLDEQLAAMDEAGIGMSVVSPNMVAELAVLELEEARDVAALLNEEVAAAQRRHPDRIAGIAVLPWQDAEASLEALERAAALDLRAVLMLSNVAGRPVAAPESWPVFERIDELRLPLFLHPASNSMVYDKGVIPIVDSSAGWVWETSQAAFTMIASGLLDHCPDLEIVHHHLGGVVPYVQGRVQRYAHYFPDVEHPVEHYLKTRFWADSMGHTPAAVPLAIETYGADRIVYGDDYPWHPHDENESFVAAHFPADVAQRVLHSNRVPSLRLGPHPSTEERTDR